VSAALAGSIAGLAAGPVAAVVAAVYALTGVVVYAARQRDAANATEFRSALAGVAAAAADLRAGGEPAAAMRDFWPVGADTESSAPIAAHVSDRPHAISLPARPDGADGLPRMDAADVLRRRAEAAVRLAQETGAPLADLLDRLEHDGRVAERARVSAATQAAGAQATAWLLAALPLAGIAFGQGIGADPAHVVLHTPIGAACAGGAMAFQLSGLAWVRRLASSITDAA
jgi:tight adherence protein B